MLNKFLIFVTETPAPELDPDTVRPGLPGLLSFVLLIAAVVIISYFLSKSLKKVNKQYPKN